MRYYSDTAPPTVLGVAVDAFATSLILGVSLDSYLSKPFGLRLNPDTGNEELVLVTAGSGTMASPYIVTRAWGSTTAKAHLAGAVAQHGVGSPDLQDSRAHEALTHSAHGGHGPVFNIRTNGALGDGSTNDTTAIQAAITTAVVYGGTVHVPYGDFAFTGDLAVTGTVRITGEGYASRLHPVNATGNTMNVSGSHVRISNLRMDGSTDGGVRVTGSATDVQIEGVYFKGIGQAVWLWACTDIAVRNCTFDDVAYGVMQQVGYVSSFVKVSGCTARSMRSDFVEANCGASAASEGWTITGNHYLGDSHYPTAQTECRFVGITNVKNVIISNNIVRNSAGDGAVHLEDVSGQALITGNTFENCVGTNAYLYFLNSAKDVIVTGNWFIHSDTSLAAQWVMDLASGTYTNRIVFAGNHVLGNSSYTFSGINFASQSNMVVSNNYFRKLGTAIGGTTSTNLLVDGNLAEDCNYGMLCDPPGTTGGTWNDVTVTNNRMYCNTKCIRVMRNTNGTGASSRWKVDGNYFSNTVEMFDTVDCSASNNVSASGKTLSLGLAYYGSSTGYVYQGNLVQGSQTGTALLAVNLGTDVDLVRYAPDVLGIADDVAITTAGKGLRIKEGSNAKAGVATLVGGAVVVSTTAVTATSRIETNIQSLGTVAAPKAIGVTARTAGTSFTITSADATDTSVVYWHIIEPA